MAETAEPAKPDGIQFSLRTAIFFTLFVGAILGLVMAGWNEVDRALQAEYTLHATTCVYVVVGQYLSDHPGKWPGSWSELEATKISPARSGMYSWPSDSNKIQKLVNIDFNVRLEDLALQNNRTFRAIRPIGPTFGYREQADPLLEMIRKYVELQTAVPKN